MGEIESPMFDLGAQLLTIEELAEWLGLDRGTIYHWRARGIGPRAIRVGDGTRGPVRYRQSDIEAWLKSREDQ